MKDWFFNSVFIFILCCNTFAQNFYDPTVIQKIEITFSQSNWDYQLDTAKAGAEKFIMAQQVLINGVAFDSVGVKYKGNSSYNPTYNKNPLHIALDEFKNQSYLGNTDVKLGNNYADPSMIREVLGYAILQNYMHCSQANFAKVYVNGVYYGVYSNAENISKAFYNKHYYSSTNTAIKCNPIINPGANSKSNLKYFTTGDSSAYKNYYEIKSKYGWNNLRTLADTVTNFSNRASYNIDMDRVIWMLAFNNVVVNLDSYTGAFCQNYYLYKDNTNHYNPTVWDLNMSFGGFPYIGSSNTSQAQLTITQMQTLSPTIHATDPYWPLINIVNSNAQFKRMYIAHIKTITNDFIANGAYVTKAQQYQTLIDTSVQNDGFKFYSYTAFQNGLTSNTSIGSYSVPGISNLMNSRLTSLQANTDFNYTSPTITAVTSNNLSPQLNNTITITANVTNATTVYLGYRNLYYKKFERILMYDDGLHNDGAANDNVFGTNITVTSALTEYYIYAENNNAGMFSPQRAEHEFYKLQTNMAQPTVSQIAINEILALNQVGQLDEKNQHEDWIELYNNSDTLLNLSGLFLSNNASNVQQYTLPQNTILNSHQFLTIWADDDLGNETNLHCNFKLSQNGEKLILSNATSIIDSVTFSLQTADKSYARCPNGVGVFNAMQAPTYNTSNCTVGINELNKQQTTFFVYPNPANNEVYVNSILENTLPIKIYNVLGNLIYTNLLLNDLQINTTAFSNGIYVVKVANKSAKLIINH